MLRVPVDIAARITGANAEEDKILIARGNVTASSVDFATTLFYLCHDNNSLISNTAMETLKSLSADIVVEISADETVHPKLLDAIARLHWTKQDVVDNLAINSALSQETASFLAAQGLALFALEVKEPIIDNEESNQVDDELLEDEVIDEENEEFKTKYQQSQVMGIGEKIKIGLTGDKEWRMILIKDSNKLVSGSVIKNPRITEPEILVIAKSAIQNDEVIRLICSNKEWVKNYQIRKALVENHKTPLPFALRYMASLTDKDLGFLAKSKNITTVLSTQARRLLNSKNKNR